MHADDCDVQAALDRATSYEEIKRLEQQLNAGLVPGKPKAQAAGGCCAVTCRHCLMNGAGTMDTQPEVDE